MAAVIDIRTAERLPSHPGGLYRTPPDLRVIEGGRDRDRDSIISEVPWRTYLLRRILVGVVAALVILGVIQVLAMAGRAVAAVADPSPTASGRVHVVQAGETAWGIAERYAPASDRRAAVEDLLELNGTGMLRAGQQLRLPTSFG